MDEEKINPEEIWKEQFEQEVKSNSGDVGEGIPSEPDFSFVVTSFAVQASIALGQMVNPITQKIEANLSQAKLIIDTLGIIKEKTQGNLSTEEDSLLDNVLYELRTQYLAKVKGEEK